MHNVTKELLQRAALAVDTRKHNGKTKAEIAREFGLEVSTLASILKQFTATGLVRPKSAARQARRSGRSVEECDEMLLKGMAWCRGVAHEGVDGHWIVKDKREDGICSRCLSVQRKAEYRDRKAVQALITADRMGRLRDEAMTELQAEMGSLQDPAAWPTAGAGRR